MPSKKESLKRRLRVDILKSTNPRPNHIESQNFLERLAQSEKTTEYYEGGTSEKGLYPGVKGIHRNDKDLNEEQRRILLDSRAMVPPQLFRAYSLQGTRSTKGFCEKTVFQPPTDRYCHRDCRDSIYDMKEGEIAVMLGHHLAWHNRNDDDFTSFELSFLFAVEHALGRSRSNQSDCHIAIVDTTKATTIPTRTSAGGESIHVFPALTVYEQSNLGPTLFWGKINLGSLHPRKFTHEFLTVGVVKYAETLHHISLDDLIKRGLFRIYPEFDIPEGAKSTGLYQRLVALRGALYSSKQSDLIPTDVEWASNLFQDVPCDAEWAQVSAHYTDPVPKQDLDFALDVARSIVISQEGDPSSHIKAPLHVVLAILSLRYRARGSRRLIGYITDNYERKKVQI